MGCRAFRAGQRQAHDPVQAGGRQAATGDGAGRCQRRQQHRDLRWRDRRGRPGHHRRADPRMSARPDAKAVPVIEIHGMSKIYNAGTEAEVAALRDVDLRVDAVEFLAIMGPSGSGKSTLMNMIGCLDRPTTGTYLCDGEDVSRLDAEELAD